MPQAFSPSQLPKEYQGGVIWAYVTDDPTSVATEGAQGQFAVLLPSGNLYQKNDAYGPAYQPTTPANWAGTAPNNVQDALDRMSNLLVTLNGGTPIP